MRGPKLILHAGLHKTGTTALQRFCSENRDGLLRKGVWYPGYNEMGKPEPVCHHDFAGAAAGEPNSENFKYSDLQKLVEQWKRGAAERVILLSSEKLCRLLLGNKGMSWRERRMAYLSRIADLLRGFDVRPLLVLRRQDDLVHSSYLENLHKGTRDGAISFSEFRSRSFESRLRFFENIEMFDELFGNVVVLTYEDLKKEDKLYENFFTTLGYDVSGLTDPGVVRRSINYEHGLLKYRINKILSTVRPIRVRGVLNRGINAILERSEIRVVLKKIVRGRRMDFWESDDVKMAFMEHFFEENERIRQRYIPERERLFPPVLEGIHPKNGSQERTPD